METSYVIWIKTQFEGWHKWETAPDHRKYLSHVHRHLFKVKVTAIVAHKHRQLEFHDLKLMTDQIIKTDLGKCKNPDFEATWSCEEMAMIIGSALKGMSIDVESVSVSEDGECGAIVRFLNDSRQR